MPLGMSGGGGVDFVTVLEGGGTEKLGLPPIPFMEGGGGGFVAIIGPPFEMGGLLLFILIRYFLSGLRLAGEEEFDWSCWCCCCCCPPPFM